MHSFVSCGSGAVDVCPRARDTCPRVSVSVKCPLRHVPQDLLLSSRNYLRYTYAPNGLGQCHTVFYSPYRCRRM